LTGRPIGGHLDEPAGLREMVGRSDLPPGEVRLDSAWVVPVVSVASNLQ